LCRVIAFKAVWHGASSRAGITDAEYKILNARSEFHAIKGTYHYYGRRKSWNPPPQIRLLKIVQKAQAKDLQHFIALVASPPPGGRDLKFLKSTIMKLILILTKIHLCRLWAIPRITQP